MGEWWCLLTNTKGIPRERYIADDGDKALGKRVVAGLSFQVNLAEAAIATVVGDASEKRNSHMLGQRKSFPFICIVATCRSYPHSSSFNNASLADSIISRPNPICGLRHVSFMDCRTQKSENPGTRSSVETYRGLAN